MIDIDVLKKVRTIVVHADCSDGLASAVILRDALPDARVVFAAHGSESYLQLPAEENMLFCDIIPPRARASEFMSKGTVVLDHHKTARSIVELFGERGIFADEATDKGTSGAVLAYREVWEPLFDPETRSWLDRALMSASGKEGLVEEFARLVGIADTWQVSDARWPEARATAEALAFYGPDRFCSENRWEAHDPWLSSDELDRGREVYKMIQQEARLIARTCPIVQRAAVFNEASVGSLKLTSDVAEELRSMKREGIDMVAGFAFVIDPNSTMHLTFSLRSISDSCDVSAIARANGGGGHTRAAGFGVPVHGDGGADPIAALERALSKSQRAQEDGYA